MKFFKHIPIFISMFLGISGCDDNLDMMVPGDSKTVTVRLSSDNLSGTDDESVINDVTGYRFVNGILDEVIIPSQTGGANIYTFVPSTFSGTLYILGNSKLLKGLETLVPGCSSLDEFLSTEGSIYEMTGNGLLMTGKTELEKLSSVVVPMTRSMARVDIESFEKGVQVQKVTIRNVADKGYVLAGKNTGTSSSASKFDFTKDYGDSPIENKCEPLLYITEQTNNSLFAEVAVSLGGGIHLLKAKLPSVIRRNELYTLRVHGKGAEMQLVIESEEWETGDSAGSAPSIRGLVDVENSIFSDGVRVNETRDTVFVPYYGSDFMLALMAEAGATVSVDGSVSGVEVNKDHGGGRASLEKIAEVSVRSSLRMPGRLPERIHLDIYDNASTNLGRVVLIIDANPVKAEGLLCFDDDATCDFKEYIDGELGVIILPANKILDLEFDADESAWIKAKEIESGSLSRTAMSGSAYRIIGGVETQ